MSRILALAVLAAICLPSAASNAGPPGTPRPEDVELFRIKCGLCHGLDETIATFPGMSLGDRAAVIEDMQGRKPGWISNPERAAIEALLAADDLGGLAAEPLQGEEAGEAGIEIIPIAHGVAMAAVFFVLGIAMALSGLKRFFEKRGILPRFPGAFVWQRHVLKGKITIACALGGLGVGLSIWALDGFSIGALPHFAVGCGVGALFAVGGLAGLRMARGKGTPALRWLHLACNLAATALFAANVVSGLILVSALIG